MEMFQFFRRLYSLDTLDTRFTITSTTPLKATELQIDPARPSPAETSPQAKQSRARNDGISNAQPSRWNTPEFYLHYLVIGIAVPLMFKVAIQVSQCMPSSQTSMEYILILLRVSPELP